MNQEIIEDPVRSEAGSNGQEEEWNGFETESEDGLFVTEDRNNVENSEEVPRVKTEDGH